MTIHPDDAPPVHTHVSLLALSALCLAFGCAMALACFYLCKNHGVVMIWLSLFLTLVLSVAVIVLSIIAEDVVGIILCGLSFLLTCWYIYAVRPKIPFAAAMLDVSLRAMSTYNTAWLLPVAGMILMGGATYLWAVCSFAIVYAVDNGSNSSAYSVRGLIYFILALSFFWSNTH